VKLTVLSVKSLKTGRKRDEERPVAVISFGNEKKETKPGTVIGSNAIWGDQFILKIEDAFDLIEIIVFSDVSKKEVIGKLFLSLHYLTPRTTYAYHLRNEKMDHLVQSMEFKIDFTYNKLLAGLKMFQPRGQTYWEDDSVDVSLTRIFELITRIKSHIVTPDFDALVQAISDIQEWQRPLISIGALIGWLLLVNFFQLWMVPLGLCIGVAATGKKKN